EASESKSPALRSRAVGVLGHFEEARIDRVILKALDDDAREVRLWGVYAAGRKLRPKLAAEFISRLKTDDREFRDALVIVLFYMAKEAVEPLVAGLDDSDPHVRAGCIMALQNTLPETAPRIAPKITRALSDDDPAVRSQALSQVAFAPHCFDREVLA